MNYVRLSVGVAVVMIGYSLFFSQRHALQAEIGQRFILTLPQTDDKAALARWLEQTRPAGVMLLAYHVKSTAQAHDYCRFLQAEAARLGLPKLIIAIDWEGGIVSRPNEAGGFYSIPSPYKLAVVGPDACYEAGYCIGRQMYDIGITMDFAPVLDLFGSRIISTRPFSADPAHAAACGIAFSRGLLDAGVEPVIKHFPGLGLGMVDTHHHAAAIAAEKDLFERHLYPFKQALGVGVRAVMATHASYAQFGELPMTRNAAAVALIKSIKPDALTITDDFFMAAGLAGVAEEGALIQALDAGYDLIIYSGNPRVDDSQVTMLKKVAALWSPAGAAATRHESKAVVSAPVVRADMPSVAESSRNLARVVAPAIPVLPLAGKRLTFITVNISAIRTPSDLFLKEPIEGWFARDGQSYLRRMLEAAGFPVAGEVLLDARDAATVDAVRAVVTEVLADPTQLVVAQTFFHGGGAVNRIQEQWLDQLMPLKDRMLLVSLGFPTEAAMVPDGNVVSLGSFHQPLLDRVADLMKSQRAAEGLKA